jgi:predicted esterase
MVRSRALGFVLSVLCVLLVWAPASVLAQVTPLEWDPVALAFVAHRSAVGAAPTVVYLHGIGGRPENGCGYFITATTEHATVCPRAPIASAPGFAWGNVDSTLATVERAGIAGGAGHNRLVLAGFSQGGYAMAAALPSLRGRVSGLLIIGANTNFTAFYLRGLGITRVALGAGRYDQTYPGLRRTYERLVAAGFAARFVDLGRVGHTYVAEGGTAVVADAVTWLVDAEVSEI